MEQENIQYFIEKKETLSDKDIKNTAICYAFGLLLMGVFSKLGYMPWWTFFVSGALWVLSFFCLAMSVLFQDEDKRKNLSVALYCFLMNISFFILAIAITYPKKYLLLAYLLFFVIWLAISLFYVQLVRLKIKKGLYNPQIKAERKKLNWRKRVNDRRLTIIYWLLLLALGIVNVCLAYQLKGYSKGGGILPFACTILAFLMWFWDFFLKWYYKKKLFPKDEQKIRFFKKLQDSKKRLKKQKKLDLDDFIICLSMLDKISFLYKDKKYDLTWKTKGLEIVLENGNKELYCSGDDFLENVRIEGRTMAEIVQDIEILQEKT